jgi:hypothetical protein
MRAAGTRWCVSFTCGDRRHGQARQGLRAVPEKPEFGPGSRSAVPARWFSAALSRLRARRDAAETDRRSGGHATRDSRTENVVRSARESLWWSCPAHDARRAVHIVDMCTGNGHLVRRPVSVIDASGYIDSFATCTQTGQPGRRELQRASSPRSRALQQGVAAIHNATLWPRSSQRGMEVAGGLMAHCVKRRGDRPGP